MGQDMGQDMGQIVLQSDFGLADGAVSAMRGVICQVSPTLAVADLTHGIPPYSRWDASYRLFQTFQYWPAGTVFTSVVDPGVGSARISAVAKLTTDQYVVTPDNGTLCHLKTHGYIEAIRQIDESKNRMRGSDRSHTFHGRDVYAYTAARLAGRVIAFEEVGAAYAVSDVVELPLCRPKYSADVLTGSIDISDAHFGNVWSNVSIELFEEFGCGVGDLLAVTILPRGDGGLPRENASLPRKNSKPLFCDTVAYGRSFADVAIGKPVLYANSLGYISIALNQANFTRTYRIDTRAHPTIKFVKSK